MQVTKEHADECAQRIAGVRGMHMDARAVVEDTYLLAVAYPEVEDFDLAVASTLRILGLLANGRLDAPSLRDDLEGWRSYHYQHRSEPGKAADCRIVYRRVDEGIIVMGFGNRHIPEHFYDRIKRTRQGL